MEKYLENPVVAPLIKKAPKRRYIKGQTIFYPHDKLNEMFIIHSGAVAMHDLDSQDRPKILHIFGASTMFPMSSFSDETVTVSWHYTALTPVEICAIPYQTLKERLEKADGVEAYNLLLRQLLGETHELLVRLSDMHKTDGYQKTVSVLRFLAKYHAQPSSSRWCRITFPVTRQLLADMTGLRRETITGILKQLQEEDLVRSIGVSKMDISRRLLNA